MLNLATYKDLRLSDIKANIFDEDAFHTFIYPIGTRGILELDRISRFYTESKNIDILLDITSKKKYVFDVYKSSYGYTIHDLLSCADITFLDQDYRTRKLIIDRFLSQNTVPYIKGVDKISYVNGIIDVLIKRNINIIAKNFGDIYNTRLPKWLRYRKRVFVSCFFKNFDTKKIDAYVLDGFGGTECIGYVDKANLKKFVYLKDCSNTQVFDVEVPKNYSKKGLLKIIKQRPDKTINSCNFNMLKSGV